LGRYFSFKSDTILPQRPPGASHVGFAVGLPQDFAEKVVWGSRYPQHDAASAWDALEKLRAAAVPQPLSPA
jgi:hypothetical protein